MYKWCFNFDSGEYENIDRYGYSLEQGKYVDNWDDTPFYYEEEQRRREEEEDNY